MYKYNTMFIDNKYTKWYHSLVKKRKEYPAAGLIERHHVIPKSLGGDDNDDNIVSFSPREHYIAHLLLARMTQGSIQHKMLKAAWLMACPTKQTRVYQVNSRIYQKLRENHSRLNGDPIRRKKTSDSMKAYQATNPWTPEKRERQRILTIERMKAAGKWRGK